MAQYTGYANYVVWFADASEYAFAVATAGGPFLETSPANAASLFGITLFPPGQPGIDLKGIYGLPPYGIPGPPAAGHNVGHPLPSGVFLFNNVDSVLVPGQAGNPASVWPAGPDLLLKWSGAILRAGGGNPTEPELETPMPQRRWIGGAFPPSAEFLGGAPPANYGRFAGRTAGGGGYFVRGANTANAMGLNIDAVAPGLNPITSWDRFYIRIRRFPTSQRVGIWAAGGFPSGNAGVRVALMPGGLVEVYSSDASSNLVLQTSIGGLPTDQWHRFDMIPFFRTGALGGNFRMWINGSIASSYVITNGTGLNQNTRHNTSDFGRWTGADPDVEYDMTDYHDSAVPEFLGVEQLDSLDWFMGSHQRRHHVVSATFGAFVPQNIQVFQPMGPATQLGPAVSTSSGAIIKGLTDAIDELDTPALTYGVVAILINQMATNGPSDGRVGYDIGGGNVLALSSQGGTATWSGTPVSMYRPSGLVEPVSVVPFSIVKEKSLDANSDTTFGIAGEASYIGSWGPEDDPSFPELVLQDYIHNSRYDNTPWAYLMPSTDAPCYSVGGTYVGNATHQTIALPAPCHFLYIRGLTVATAPIVMFAAGTGANLGTTERLIDNVDMWTDIDGNAFFRVGGNDNAVNANAVVYQYIAFCDPGMRFCYTGAYAKATALAGFPSIPFVDPNFTIEGLFVQFQQANSISNVQGLWWKGPGSGANDARVMTGAVSNNFGQLGTGGFNAGVDIRPNSQNQMTYIGFRSSEPNCAGIMCQIFSYVGNGAGGTRVINVSPAGGRFPLLVMVFPQAAAAAFMKDPSHVGTTSCQITNPLTTSTTAITAVGIDTITVGTTLNANLVNYSVFIIPGDSAGFNNGVFFNPNCEGFPGPIPGPPLPAVMGEGGLVLDGTTPLTLLRDVSGIYTLVPGKRNDTFMDRQAGQPSVDIKIPDPTYKTGYVGG